MKRTLTLFQRSCSKPWQMKGTARLLALLATACGIAAAPAVAQDIVAPCRLCLAGEPAEKAKPSQPVRLEVEARLDFDRIVTAGSGTGRAELGPDGSRSVSGSVAAMSARAMVGEVLVRGEPGREVRIELPRTIELFGHSGGSIRVDAIRSDLPNMPRLDSNGRLSFRLGGVIHLTGDSDGEFRGDARIGVDYL